MFGLSNGDTNQGYADIDYAFYIYPTAGLLLVYEKGVGMGSGPYAVNDTLRVSVDAGNSRENLHLISFDTSVVSANTAGRPVYTSDGTGAGTCNLTCHNTKHDGGLVHRY